MSYIAITPRRRGRGLVHAAELTAKTTLCGRRHDGWIVAASAVSCDRCQREIVRVIENK